MTGTIRLFLLEQCTKNVTGAEMELVHNWLKAAIRIIAWWLLFQEVWLLVSVTINYIRRETL